MKLKFTVGGMDTILPPTKIEVVLQRVVGLLGLEYMIMLIVSSKLLLWLIPDKAEASHM